MTKRKRYDSPGAWHHVMNRGVARRQVFEGQRDAGEFMGRAGEVVEAGLLEVHAYCLMGNHVHLLARSPQGQLGEAMKLLFNGYSRWFNRMRKRDGPLWRGRFLSKRVRTDAYRETLVRYIDYNPVKAKLVATPSDYPWSSAWHYARSTSGPTWLTREWVEGLTRSRTGSERYLPSDYGLALGPPLPESLDWMISAHGFSHLDPELALGRILRGQSRRTRAWLAQRLETADGKQAQPSPTFAPARIQAALSEPRGLTPTWEVRASGRRKPGWRVLECALLFRFSACPLSEIQRLVGCSRQTVQSDVADHLALQGNDMTYRSRSRRLTEQLARECSPDAIRSPAPAA